MARSHASASSSVGSSGATARNSSRLRSRTSPVARTVADLVEVVGMRDHERPARQVEHVELDRVDARVDGGLERAQRVLGRKRRRAAVPHPERPVAVAAQPDHGRVGR